MLFPQMVSLQDLVDSSPSFMDVFYFNDWLKPGIIGRKGGDEGIFNFNSKAVKREKKYSKYAFLVLLGIFGLTGPLFMKILSIIAAQALMASKAALIIVGSIALKKLFEKKEDEPVVKVATLPLHDPYDDEDIKHDRLGFVGGQGFGNKQRFHASPYFGYYKEK